MINVSVTIYVKILVTPDLVESEFSRYKRAHSLAVKFPDGCKNRSNKYK
jgi:hypothetical protein